MLPAVNPAEHRVFLAALYADVGRHDRGLEPFERITQLSVVFTSRGASDSFENIVRLEFELARYVIRSAILHVAQDRCRPDQDIGVPNGPHAIVLMRPYGHEYPVILVDVLDGFHPFRL